MPAAPPMRLLGFNVGRIRAQTIDGEIVRTGYVKSPASEPWEIHSTGAAGDEVAVHSDHLYAFDRASYDHWARELAVDRESWPDGHFAENLTLDAIDQSELRVGDRFRLGGAVLVVTGPRVPCWKLTWRLGQPKTFMRRFRLSGHSGVYLGVLEPGVVSPGDAFELLHREVDAPTVRELSVLCDSGTRVSAEQRAVVERALANPHLSRTVRDTLVLKVANLDRDEDALAHGWSGWRRFDVDSVTPEITDVVSVSLRPADGGPLPRAEAGQHVVVRISKPGRAAIVRTWSLSSYAAEPERYRLTVRVRPGGRGSGALASGGAGVRLDLRAPAGRFRLDRGSFRPVVLVAVGIGITPMIAMLQAHIERAVHVPPVWVLYGSTEPEQTAFRSILDGLASRHPDVHVHYFHSRSQPHPPHPSSVPHVTRHSGRLSAGRIIEVLRSNYLQTPDGPVPIPWFESDVYLCGPIDFTATVRADLVAAGANPDHVADEDFAEATVGVLPSRTDDAIVEFTPHARRVFWRPAAERTLLELAEDAGLDVPFDCRSGSCRTCEARLVDGEVDGPSRTDPDGTTRVLLCTSYPRTSRVTIEPPNGH